MLESKEPRIFGFFLLTWTRGLEPVKDKNDPGDEDGGRVERQYYSPDCHCGGHFSSTANLKIFDKN